MYKRRVFHSILLTDIIIVLILVAMMIPLCYLMVNTIRMREINDCHNTMLNTLNILDNQLNNLKNILTKTSVHKNLVRVSLINGQMQPRDYYALLEAQQYLAAIASSNNYVADIIISFKSNDIILTKYAIFDNTSAFRHYYNIGNVDNMLLSKEMLPSIHSFEFLPETTITCSSPKSANNKVPLEVFCYKLPLRLTDAPSNSALAYIFIDSKYIIDNALSQSFRENGSLQLQDHQENIILTYGDNPTSLTYKDIKHYNKSVNGINHSIINATNSTDTLRIIASIPVKAFLADMHNIFLLISFYIATTILLGISMSFWVAYRQSAPLKQLLSHLEIQVSDKTQEYESEYEFIKNSIIRMKSNKENILQQLEEFQNTLKANMIERLLCSGQLTNKQQDNILQHLNNFPKTFVVGYGEFQHRAQAYNQSTDVITMLTVDYLKKELPSNTLYHRLEKNTFALIIPYYDQDITMQSISRAIHYSNTNTPTKIKLAISTPYTGLANVNIAFEQARFLSTLESQDNYLLTASNIMPSSNSTHDIRDYLDLYHLVVAADFPAVEKYIRQMFKFVDVPNTDMEQLYYMIRMTLLFAVRDYTSDEDTIPHIPKYQSHHSPEQMIETLCDIGYDICNIINNNKRSHNIKLKNAILEYINQNFTDSNLYAEQIAARFSISEKYLYNFIKEQTGYSLGDYLQKLRLEYAATLLMNSEQSITSISKECGYLTYNTFYKAFKRVYGVSPSEYREKLLQIEL